MHVQGLAFGCDRKHKITIADCLYSGHMTTVHQLHSRQQLLRRAQRFVLPDVVSVF